MDINHLLRVNVDFSCFKQHPSNFNSILVLTSTDGGTRLLLDMTACLILSLDNSQISMVKYEHHQKLF